jgi:hypothetical protein
MTIRASILCAAASLAALTLAAPAAAQSDGFQAVRPASAPVRPRTETEPPARSARPPAQSERPPAPAAPSEDLAIKCRRLVQERYPSGTLSRSRGERERLEASCVAGGGTLR